MRPAQWRLAPKAPRHTGQGGGHKWVATARGGQAASSCARRCWARMRGHHFAFNQGMTADTILPQLAARVAHPTYANMPIIFPALPW
jgi:hypothetical protein